jgi:hypothetical protein
MHPSNVAIPVDRSHAKASREETKIQEFVCRDTANVKHEMCDYTGINWSHWNSNKRFKEKFVGHTRKTFSSHYKRQLYLEHHTSYGKYYSLKLEA